MTAVRSYVVFVLLLLMSGAMGVLLATRPRVSHVAAAAPTSAPSSSAGRTVVLADGGVATTAADGGLAPAADASLTPRMDRPLHVATLGWEAAAPGVMANHGTAPGMGSAFAADRLSVQIAPAETMTGIEDALARGGGDADGADVAIVPLPVFVASYERLRALAPEIFFVVGFSRGREGLRALRPNVLDGETEHDMRMTVIPGSSSAFFGLFALDAAGIPLDRVTMVPESQASGLPLYAVDRTSTEEGNDQAGTSRRLILTTADAARLIPLVAIAPHAFVEQHADALRALMQGWLAGAERIRADVPSAARSVASAAHAPTAVVLLHRLGLVEGASLRDNTHLAGLAGRGAVTLERLFQRTWRVWRGAGVLTTAAPETSPLSTNIIASLARSDASLRGTRPPVVTEPAGPQAGPSSPPAGVTTVLSRPFTGARLDENALVEEIGFLAGVFDRSPLRVTLRGGDQNRTRALLANARGRFDIAPTRLYPGRTLPSGTQALLEVLSVP